MNLQFEIMMRDTYKTTKMRPLAFLLKDAMFYRLKLIRKLHKHPKRGFAASVSY